MVQVYLDKSNKISYDAFSTFLNLKELYHVSILPGHLRKRRQRGPLDNYYTNIFYPRLLLLHVGAP